MTETITKVGDWRLVSWKEVKQPGGRAGAYLRGSNFNLYTNEKYAIQSVWRKEETVLCAPFPHQEGELATLDQIETHIAKNFQRMLLVTAGWNDGKWKGTFVHHAAKVGEVKVRRRDRFIAWVIRVLG